ncbi:aminoglycoside phosphotransferase family protein [Profundibacter sp.]|uniref:aminoglycoside phosphotransferase family protein n=1 Tax=Profundibacter sp. TaxID=3101071 RepID=UPI003D0A0DDC
MPDRPILITQFLADSGWGNATRSHLAGDASNRSYQRLQMNGKTAVLMDAPPDHGEDIRPFATITNHLLTLGFTAPRILALDPQNGFLLIEDLGDALFAKLIQTSPDMEQPLYSAATDVLIRLHKSPPPDHLLDYNPAVMADYIAPLFEWYHPANATPIQHELQTVLTKYCTAPPVMSLRDYHAENLLWLPDRDGIKRVGLLDYQDAVKTHPAYDLVSLLKDARRDVPATIEAAMITRYITATGIDPETFRAAYAALGVQRNLRILGIFARLCAVAGKPHYIDLIPRVWAQLNQMLTHPALATLQTLVQNTLPKPTPDHLQRLKSQCAKSRTP